MLFKDESFVVSVTILLFVYFLLLVVFYWLGPVDNIFSIGKMVGNAFFL